MLGVKDLRQAPPAHIASQNVFFFAAGHGDAVVRQFLELFNGPQVIGQFDTGPTYANGAQWDAIVLTRVSIPI